MAEIRPVIFLYTEAAQIDAHTRKAMVAAGFLPVKVSSLDAVKIIDSPMVIADAELPYVVRSALDAIGAYSSPSIRDAFATRLIGLLTHAADVAAKEREAVRKELRDG